MRTLLRAALKTKKHFSLAVLSICGLLLLTVASQLEMFSFGVLTRTSADFFDLFGKKSHGGYHTTDVVTKEMIDKRWAEIDTRGRGRISKGDAAAYLSGRKEKNLINAFVKKAGKYFDLEGKSVKLVAMLIAIAMLFKATMLFFSRFATQLLSIRISRDLRQQYFEHIQQLPMDFYHKYNIGTLSSRVAGDASQIANALNSFLTNYIQLPFVIMTTLGACIWMSWQLSLVIFVGLPLIVLPVVFVTRAVKRVTRQLQRNQERFTSVLIDFLAGIQTVKIFCMEPFSRKKYKEQNDQMAALETKTARYDLLTRPVLHTVSIFCLCVVLFVGQHVLNMTLAEVLVFCGMLHLFYEPVKKFAEENANIQKGAVAAERLFEVLNIDPSITDSEGASVLTDFKKSIEFEDVWFRYQDEWILKGVSFSINKGETVAIVGSTGAGKSTIVQLLPRLYEVQRGRILVDGRPLSDYTNRSLRSQIAYVPQKPFLFYDTIASNISYGEDFTEEEITMAAKRAYAHEFIEKLPNQYETQLCETGKNLSGGQQQRIAIARALVKKASILVLDEATSSLDSISESKIQKAIIDLQGKVTQVIIAHRLTTIQHADRIIFLEHGEKIAEGTKAELLDSCPAFRLMWETHFDTLTKKSLSLESV